MGLKISMRLLMRKKAPLLLNNQDFIKKMKSTFKNIVSKQKRDRIR